MIKIKHLFILMFVMMLIASVMSTPMATSSIEVQGAGGIGIHTSTRTSEVTADGIGSHGTYQIQSASRKVLTVGMASIKAKEVSNQQYKNTLDSSVEGEFRDAALVSDRYVLEDNKNVDGSASWYAALNENATPSYQYVETEALQMGSGGGAYKSAGVMNEANLTSSISAEGNAGGITYKTYATTEAGFTPGSNDIDFRKTERTYDGQFDKNGTGYELGIDYIWKDSSNPFEVVNNTTSSLNKTTEVNLTE